MPLPRASSLSPSLTGSVCRFGVVVGLVLSLTLSLAVVQGCIVVSFCRCFVFVIVVFRRLSRFGVVVALCLFEVVNCIAICVRVRPNKRGESCRVLISRWRLFRVFYTCACFAFFGLVFSVFRLVLGLSCFALPALSCLAFFLPCLVLYYGGSSSFDLSCLVLWLSCRVVVLSYLVLGRACLLLILSSSLVFFVVF